MQAENAAPRNKWLDITVISPVRALTLMCAGALIGTVLGVQTLMAEKGKGVVVGVPPEDVAIVNGVPIARSDFDAELLLNYKVDPAHATPAQKRRTLDLLIDQELYVERGKSLYVDRYDSELRAILFSAVEAQVTADALTAQVDDAKLRRYFEANPARYAGEGFLALRDFVFPASADGEKIVAALKAARGAPAAAAKFGGRDSNRVKGEEFYFAAKVHLGDDLYAQAVALATGAVSAPISRPDGLHVLYIVENKPPREPSFESAKGDVQRDFMAEAAGKLRAGEDSFFVRRANIIIAADLK
jgi:hypothetical protein